MIPPEQQAELEQAVRALKRDILLALDPVVGFLLRLARRFTR